MSRHFPGSIDPGVLRDWFLQASSDFFGFNGAEWVKSISKTTTTRFAQPQTIKDLLTVSIKKYSLEAHENGLVEAYYAFLTSEDPADLQYVMNLGYAMFSAQLVAADTGADPITIDEIRGATFVLDTNALFAIQLDAHRLARSIRALSIALTDIDVELIYLAATRQEYRRVYVGKKGEIAALFRNYPTEVVLDAKSDFIETGISHGCKTGADFDDFLNTICNPPSELPSGHYGYHPPRYERPPAYDRKCYTDKATATIMTIGAIGYFNDTGDEYVRSCGAGAVPPALFAPHT